MAKARRTANKQLEPKQDRSRESLRKLMKAAAEVLGQHDLQGATIPRIARHAGLSPGSVYRRFPDKNALLEAVVLGILQRQLERNATVLTQEAAAQIPLPILAEQVIGGMVLSYRANAPLLRAIRQFVCGKAHTPFWRKATKLEMQSVEHLVGLFMTHREQIKHPNPRLGIATALLMLTSTLFELVVLPTDLGPVKSLLPRDDVALGKELLRAFLSYLGVESGRAAPGNR